MKFFIYKRAKLNFWTNSDIKKKKNAFRKK